MTTRAMTAFDSQCRHLYLRCLELAADQVGCYKKRDAGRVGNTNRHPWVVSSVNCRRLASILLPCCSRSASHLWRPLSCHVKVKPTTSGRSAAAPSGRPARIRGISTISRTSPLPRQPRQADRPSREGLHRSEGRSAAGHRGEAGGTTTRKGSSRPTIRRWRTCWRNTSRNDRSGVSGNGRRSRRHVVGARPFGEWRLSQITTETIRQFQRQRPRTSGNRDLALLRAAFNWAIADGPAAIVTVQGRERADYPSAPRNRPAADGYSQENRNGSWRRRRACSGTSSWPRSRPGAGAANS